MKSAIGRLAAFALLPVLLCSGCGTASKPANKSDAPPPPDSMSLATSLVTSQGTWVVVPMGAPSGPNQFWQLFLLASGQRSWRLDTPPDIATNGAPALAQAPGSVLVIGVRPSLYLTFSPVSRTSDDGRTWTAGSPAPGLANVPDALASAPAGSQLLALTRTGQVSITSTGGGSWSKLATEQSVAASQAGRDCGLDVLTAVAFDRSTPVLGGNCLRPGLAGVFARHDDRWNSFGPPLPAGSDSQPVKLLRLAATGKGLTVILQVGAGSASQLIAAWLDQRGQWTLSVPLGIPDQHVIASALGASGSAAVALSGGHAEIVAAGPGAAWHETPPLPAAPSIAIALPSDGPMTALAGDGGNLTVWQLTSSPSASWAKRQQIKVAIQYGSSS